MGYNPSYKWDKWATKYDVAFLMRILLESSIDQPVAFSQGLLSDGWLGRIGDGCPLTAPELQSVLWGGIPSGKHTKSY